MTPNSASPLKLSTITSAVTVRNTPRSVTISMIGKIRVRVRVKG